MLSSTSGRQMLVDGSHPNAPPRIQTLKRQRESSPDPNHRWVKSNRALRHLRDHRLPPAKESKQGKSRPKPLSRGSHGGREDTLDERGETIPLHSLSDEPVTLRRGLETAASESVFTDFLRFPSDSGHDTSPVYDQNQLPALELKKSQTQQPMEQQRREASTAVRKREETWRKYLATHSHPTRIDEDITPTEEEPYIIKCICGIKDDDGNTVFCDKCDTWQHIRCYYDDWDAPNIHNCATCDPEAYARTVAFNAKARGMRDHQIPPEDLKKLQPIAKEQGYEKLSGRATPSKVVWGPDSTHTYDLDTEDATEADTEGPSWSLTEQRRLEEPRMEKRRLFVKHTISEDHTDGLEADRLKKLRIITTRSICRISRDHSQKETPLWQFRSRRDADQWLRR